MSKVVWDGTVEGEQPAGVDLSRPSRVMMVAPNTQLGAAIPSLSALGITGGQEAARAHHGTPNGKKGDIVLG